jgi:hypothetical protein
MPSPPANDLTATPARCVLSMISASHGNIPLAYALRGLP